MRRRDVRNWEVEELWKLPRGFQSDCVEVEMSASFSIPPKTKFWYPSLDPLYITRRRRFSRGSGECAWIDVVVLGRSIETRRSFSHQLWQPQGCTYMSFVWGKNSAFNRMISILMGESEFVRCGVAAWTCDTVLASTCTRLKNAPCERTHISCVGPKWARKQTVVQGSKMTRGKVLKHPRRPICV